MGWRGIASTGLTSAGGVGLTSAKLLLIEGTKAVSASRVNKQGLQSRAYQSPYPWTHKTNLTLWGHADVSPLPPQVGSVGNTFLKGVFRYRCESRHPRCDLL